MWLERKKQRNKEDKEIGKNKYRKKNFIEEKNKEIVAKG